MTGTRVRVEVRRGAYADSVTLMQVSRSVATGDGVDAAMVAMATPLNLEILTGMGFDHPEAGPNDLVIAVRVTAKEQLEPALRAAEEALEASARRRPEATEAHPTPFRTIGSALRSSDAGLVLVSVPGPHAFVEAMDALHAGRDVMVFSDNVPVEQEVALKVEAERRDLLVLGPDCGTAVVGGLGLGFANVVSPGPVGVVAASGTGCQQLITLLDSAGVGISAALGVGGRDLSEVVGGRSTLQALRMLDADPATGLIVVVSKPPAGSVARAVADAAARLATPVQFAFLGPGQPDLSATAARVVRAVGLPEPSWPSWGADAETDTGPRGGGYLRGLFCGGTLCDEAMLIAGGQLGTVRSNIPLSPALALGPDLGVGLHAHLMVDFGDDALTVGRAHPMIDPSLRLQHLVVHTADPSTAVLLLDVVLGHGSHPDPAADLAPVIATAAMPVVVSCVGTAADPQGLDRQARALAEAGAVVFASNAEATRHALGLLGGRR